MFLILNSYKIFLILQPTNESYQTHNNQRSNYGSNVSPSTDDAILQIVKPKGYGALKLNAKPQKLTYTWKGVDVFGEIPTEGSVGKTVLNRFKSCCGGNGRDPIARKHLLKNG